MRTSSVIVPLQDLFSFDLGVLRFTEKEVGAKFQELKSQCVRAWGENQSNFSLHGIKREVQSSTEGPAVLLKHSSLFLSLTKFKLALIN